MQRIRKSGTAGRIPLASEMSFGELILNYRDGKLFYKNHDGIIKSFNSEELSGSVASFSWDSSYSTPNAVDYVAGVTKVTNTHRGMRRCVLKDDGTVNYYLNPFNSAYKETGAAADLSGADGMVMVQIPKFYTKRMVSGTITTWLISDLPLPGFGLHPAFIKDGIEVDYRYYGAYDGCVWTTGTTYQSGLNYDDNVGAGQNWNTGTAKLASVSGIYPAIGITRAEARTLAANRGAGWRQIDFWLVQAIQMLYLIEYQSFYSQLLLGAGNTSGSYVAPSANQTDSPHTIAGASNAFSNISTNGTQLSAGAKPGTAFMNYRGIENWFGNIWNWVDGFNVNNNQAYVSNTRANFADDTSTNYTALGSAMPNTDGYPINQQSIDNAFLPSAVGGSTSTYLTDYYWQATGWRTALFGGGAFDGALAGAFCWLCFVASSAVSRSFGARLAF